MKFYVLKNQRTEFLVEAYNLDFLMNDLFSKELGFVKVKGVYNITREQVKTAAKENNWEIREIEGHYFIKVTA